MATTVSLRGKTRVKRVIVGKPIRRITQSSGSVGALADVNIEDAIKAAPVAVAAAAPAAASGGDAPKEESKKAEPPSEKQEEAAMEGLSSLFG